MNHEWHSIPYIDEDISNSMVQSDSNRHQKSRSNSADSSSASCQFRLKHIHPNLSRPSIGGLSQNSANSKRQSHDVRGFWQLFFVTTTFHGLKIFVFNFQHGHGWKKCIWFVIMTLCFLAAVLQLTLLLREFLQDPVVTKIQLKYPPDGLSIPPVTLCMLAKLNETKVKELYPEIWNQANLTEFATSSFFSAYGTALMDLNYFERIAPNISRTSLQKQLDGALEKAEKNLSQFLEDTAFTCEDIFQNCWFQNGELFECCRPNEIAYLKRHLLHSGVCFEVIVSKKQILPGPVGGFGFVMWYPNGHILKTAFNAYDEHAIHLFTSPPEAMLEMNPAALPVGYHVHVALEATEIISDSRALTIFTNAASETDIALVDDDNSGMNFGVRGCKPPSKLHFFDEYSYSGCQVECLINTLLQECNCTGVSSYGKIPRDRLCSPFESLKCYRKVAYNFTSILLKCRNERCREACRYWTYKCSLTAGKLFNPSLEHHMINYWRLNNFEGSTSDSLLIADVYFEEIQNVEVRQIAAITLSRFFSCIGGAMCLWMGASFITWVHLAYFLTVYWCGSKRPRETPKTDIRLNESIKRSLMGDDNSSN